MSIASEAPLQTRRRPIKYTEQRPYINSPGVKYILPSDRNERVRLNLQHRLIKATFDGKNILSPISIAARDHVLDCATGTAIWLLDMALTLPNSVFLHGVDIESRLFPSAKDMPRNIKLHTANITSLPLDWTNKFKFVHQRLLMLALQRFQWPLVMRELFRVTKPGGWIELCEGGEYTAGPINERHKDIHRALKEHRGLFHGCARFLPTMLAEAGFVNIRVDSRPATLAGDAGADMRIALKGAWAGTKAPVLDAGGFGLVHSEEEFDQLLKDVEKEWEETPEAVVYWVTVSAQKRQN